MAGTENYTRLGVGIANGVSPTGVLTFELRAWRTWGGAGCENSYQIVNNSSWIITVHYTIPGPMMYTSSTTTQASISTVPNCQTSAEILGVEVTMNGGLSPLNITQFTIGIAGTTNIGELSGTSIYYTGTTSTYSPINLFATVAPGGTVVMNGSQTLLAGTNYFWVVHNLITPTTIANALDGTCTNIIVDGTGYAPLINSPAGNRIIGACNPDPGGVVGSTTWFVPEAGYMTLGGSNVSQWNSTVGGVNVNQARGTAQPLFSSVDASVNFNGSVLFDGTTDELSQVSASGILGQQERLLQYFDI
ncbi:MAG: hypothetical protein ACI837_000922 [Crocinitomicaceae bacterium]